MRLALALVVLALLPASAGAATIGDCPVFPRSYVLNQRVDRLPVAAGSARIVASIGEERGVHPDFGSGTWEGRPIGIPYDVVDRRTTRSRVRFGYADESDRVRYPIPSGVHIEGGRDADGDRHALLLDRDDPSLPRMGERLRLKAGVDVSGLPRQARVVARALQRYGLVVADNGSDWYVSGAPHPRWDNDQLAALGRLRGRDFEVVDASSLRR
jgi:hypothetical protein